MGLIIFGGLKLIEMAQSMKLKDGYLKKELNDVVMKTLKIGRN